jgi:hypothetical protein
MSLGGIRLPQPLHLDTAELRLNGGRLDASQRRNVYSANSECARARRLPERICGQVFAAEQVRDTWDRADAARADCLGDIALNLYRRADRKAHGWHYAGGRYLGTIITGTGEWRRIFEAAEPRKT